MGTKKCPNFEKCGNTIDEKYLRCMKCNEDSKKELTEVKAAEKDELLKVLNQMNWNLGRIAAALEGNKDLAKKLKDNKPKK